MRAGEPEPVPRGLVEQLSQRAEANNGVRVSFCLKSGDTVSVTAGPFAELMGTLESLDDHGRVRILLEYYGWEVPVVLSGRVMSRLERYEPASIPLFGATTLAARTCDSCAASSNWVRFVLRFRAEEPARIHQMFSGRAALCGQLSADRFTGALDERNSSGRLRIRWVLVPAPRHRRTGWPRLSIPRSSNLGIRQVEKTPTEVPKGVPGGLRNLRTPAPGDRQC